jgi:hypothetical protein
MIKTSITIDEAVAVLNEAVKADPVAITKLCLRRVDCNTALNDHPTIQTGEKSIKTDGIFADILALFGPGFELAKYEVGMLGIINGLFGVDEEGCGAVAAVFDIFCPSGCDLKNMPDAKYGHKCPGCCGSKIQLGDILRFEVRK